MFSEDSVTDRFGPIVWRDKTTVIRVNARTRRVTLHEVDPAGNELLPRGYLVGTNVIRLLSD